MHSFILFISENKTAFGTSVSVLQPAAGLMINSWASWKCTLFKANSGRFSLCLQGNSWLSTCMQIKITSPPPSGDVSPLPCSGPKAEVGLLPPNLVLI